MIPMSEQQRTVLRDDLLRLTEQCPVEGGNPVDCPLFDVRQLAPAKRRHWVEALTQDELAYLNAYHCVCAQLKIEPPLPHV